jgi:hypothetical protein
MGGPLRRLTGLRPLGLTIDLSLWEDLAPLNRPAPLSLSADPPSPDHQQPVGCSRAQMEEPVCPTYGQAESTMKICLPPTLSADEETALRLSRRLPDELDYQGHKPNFEETMLHFHQVTKANYLKQLANLTDPSWSLTPYGGVGVDGVDDPLPEPLLPSLPPPPPLPTPSLLPLSPSSPLLDLTLPSSPTSLPQREPSSPTLDETRKRGRSPQPTSWQAHPDRFEPQDKLVKASFPGYGGFPPLPL